MIYTDYYDEDEFNRAFNEIVKLDNSGVDPYYNLISMHNLNGEQLTEEQKKTGCVGKSPDCI